MTEFEFAVYDLVRRVQEETGVAHQVDVAVKAISEARFQGGIFQAVDWLRPALLKLVTLGAIKRHRNTLNTYVVAQDLLTVMAHQL